MAFPRLGASRPKLPAVHISVGRSKLFSVQLAPNWTLPSVQVIEEFFQLDKRSASLRLSVYGLALEADKINGVHPSQSNRRRDEIGQCG